MSQPRWRRYLPSFRKDLRADVDDELRFHVEMLVQELVAAGWAPPAARAEAERRFGAMPPVRDACLVIDWRLHRRTARTDLMTAIVQDIRYVARTLRASPGFSVVVTLTLALAIGVTTAIVGVVDTVLLRPLPYREPQNLVALFDVQGTAGGFPASYPEFRDWASRSGDALSDVGAWINTGEVLSGSGDAEQLTGARISANVPDMLGIRPLIGRVFRPDEEAAAANRVVMLSEGVWRTHFAGDPGLVGRTIVLTDEPYVVVGVYPGVARSVLPSRFQYAKGRPVDFWLPLRLTEKDSPRSMHWLSVVGRLRPGMTLPQARLRLAAMAAGLEKDGVTTHAIDVQPLAPILVGDVRSPLRLLLGAVVALFLIGCANVANLMLARSSSRRREFAVRAALGAGRQRIVILVLVESLVRGVIGGVCGLGLAYGMIAVARNSLQTTIPRMSEVTIDARVLGLAIAISLASGVLFGLVPAIRAAREDLVAGLRDGGRGARGSVSRDRVRRALIVAEIALSFVLLVTGGLLARSFINLVTVPTGFDPEGLVAARTWLPPTRYPDSIAQLAFWARFDRRLREVTGEHTITMTDALPVESGTSGQVSIAGKVYPNGTQPVAEKRAVAPNYFSALRATITSGRSFQSTDVLGAPGVAVVNQAFVRRWLPGENPIGKRVTSGFGLSGDQTIVGVVADVREGPLDQASRPAVYVSTLQRPSYYLNVVMRTTRPEREIANAFRRVLKEIDPALPLVDVRRVSDVMLSSVRQQRIVTAILGTFALTALVLAAVGLYGVISYTVAQRTQEFGIRAALGARAGDIARLVLGQTASYAIGGLGFGLIGAMASAGLVARQLFGVTSRDPAVFIGVACLLAIVSFVASAVPTARALRANPVEALRDD